MDAEAFQICVSLDYMIQLVMMILNLDFCLLDTGHVMHVDNKQQGGLLQTANLEFSVDHLAALGCQMRYWEQILKIFVSQLTTLWLKLYVCVPHANTLLFFWFICLYLLAFGIIFMTTRHHHYQQPLTLKWSEVRLWGTCCKFLRARQTVGRMPQLLLVINQEATRSVNYTVHL